MFRSPSGRRPLQHPKYRRAAFARKDIRDCLKRLLKAICKQREYRIHAMEVMPDHVHMFVELPPRDSPSTAVQYLKGKTAYHPFRVLPELRD